MKKFFKDLFSSKLSVSSKRVCGFLGWLVCMAVALISTINASEVTGYMDTVIITSAALLGLDSVTNIWKNNSNSESESNTEEKTLKRSRRNKAFDDEMG